MKKSSTYLNVSKGQKEQIGRLLRMYADHREDIDEMAPATLVQYWD